MTAAPDQPGPGRLLQAARAAMNVEVREVADALNLPASSIEAIEANAFELLPSRVFARGYLRAYAKLVELDPDAIVESFQKTSGSHADAQPAVAPSAPLVPSEHQSLSARLGAFRTRTEGRIRANPFVSLGVLAGLLFGLFLLAWQLFGGAKVAVTTAAANPASVPAGRLPPSPIGSEQAGAEQALRGGFTDVSDDPNAAFARPVSSADSVVPLGPGDAHLRFSFAADCWVEVRNAQDLVLYSDLGQSNKQLELTGEGPFRILLGYAPGVRIAFNGEPVALAPHTRNDVARLVLGQ